MANTTHWNHPVMRERRVYALAAALYSRADVLVGRDKDRQAVITTDCFQAAEIFMREADERMQKAIKKGTDELEKKLT
jgi:hypothetical protein